MDMSSRVILIVGIFCCCVFVCRAIDTGCPTTSYRCHNNNECVPIKYICDGDTDCPLGDDEEHCDQRVSGCGDEAYQYGVNGSISSMRYPSPYYNMANCRWQIESPPGTILVLSFDDLFDIEKSRHGGCVYDRVIVFQASPLLKVGEYCGGVRPTPIYIHTNKAVVEFLTDRDNGGKGFRLTWTSQGNGTIYTSYSTHRSSTPENPTNPTHRSSTSENPTNPTHRSSTSENPTTPTHPATTINVHSSLCPFTVYKGGMTGQFKSPSPKVGEYNGTRATCRWLISVDAGYFISLTFKSFFLSDKFPPFACQDASLEVYDGENELAPLKEKLCGPFNPGQIESSSNSMLVVMTCPRGLGAGIGFNAAYSAVLKPQTTTLGPAPIGCDGTPIVITSPHGFITSPNFNGITPYRNFLDCQWILVGTSDEVFAFSFVDLEVEHSSDCRFDYVRIADSYVNGSVAMPHVPLWNETFCSLKLPPDAESKTANVMVTFHSDDQVAGLGFNLTFRLGPPSVVCSDDQFKCGSGECINASLVCDSVPSCSDNSDEIVCPNMTGCGEPPISANLIEHRIVGGAEAVVGAWPWTVSILSPEGTHLCGASLVFPGWVISAAHCFDQVYNGKYGTYSVMAGRHELLQSSRNEQRRYIDDVFTPKDYVSSTSQNDIALVKLASHFDLSDTVNLVCLPQTKAESDELGWITGWGETLNSCCAGKLKQAMVPVLNATLCREYYSGQIYDHMMCAGYPQGGVDSCRGDSGGPFVIQRQDDGRWELQGVTSWGELCGLPRTPGVYTVVHDFWGWIRQTIALHQD